MAISHVPDLTAATLRAEAGVNSLGPLNAKMDKYELEAMKSRPDGYYFVRSGPLRPDDLCWSVMERKWRRFDDPGWLHILTDADQAFCLVRKARLEPAQGQATRSYTIKQPPAEDPPKAAVNSGQQTLFG